MKDCYDVLEMTVSKLKKERAILTKALSRAPAGRLMDICREWDPAVFQYART